MTPEQIELLSDPTVIVGLGIIAVVITMVCGAWLCEASFTVGRWWSHWWEYQCIKSELRARKRRLARLGR